MSGNMKDFVPVPQECMGYVIGSKGRHINQIQKETNTKIRSCNGDHSGRESGFTVIGNKADIEAAREAIQRRVTVSKEYAVPRKYLWLIRHTNKENVETKSKTKIRLPRQDVRGQKVVLTIFGHEKDIDRAKSLIKSCIISFEDKMKRKEFGGNQQFVCLDFDDKNSVFHLKESGSAPKLDAYIRGQRYRVENEREDNESESNVGDKTVSELKDHLLTSLQKLHDLKDKQQLMIDLWCHFGKVFVHNVDEGEARSIVTPEEICGKIQKIVSPVKTTGEQGYWKVTFEEGVDPSDVDDSLFPEAGDDDEFDFHLKLVHTQWRYDFALTTASARNVRLKIWEGLPPGRNEPPVEVKNILAPVFLQGENNLKAWICYPSTSVLRGEIMTPNSEYDCRMKLRAGSRDVIDKDSVCEEEDMILCDYLSNCKFDTEAKYRMELPDTKVYPMPQDFDCTFYREAKERMYSATFNEKQFTVILLDEKGWDSDSSTKRDQEQFGIRVMMDSWSELLLSPERNWKPEEILDKVKDYMVFLSELKKYLFE